MSGNFDQHFNFPYQHGASVKNREVFSNYGSSNIIHVNQDGEIVSARTKGENYVRLAAVHPVLPLSCRAEKVKLPLKDRIMGPIVEKNKNLKSFALKVQKFHISGKRYGKLDQLEEILSAVEDYKTGSATTDYLSDPSNEVASEQMKPWFRALLKDYTSLQGSAGPQFNNPRYTGGCMSSIGVNDTHCYIASAAGVKFNKLRLTCVSEQTEGLLHSYSAEEINLGNTIYGIRSRRVQGEDFATVRTASECYLYKVTPDSAERKLHQVAEPQNMYCSAVDISPYITGECVLVDETGRCHLWSGDTILDVPVHCEPRFPVSDSWRHIQYSSHPRQLIYADQTALQCFDLRMPNKEALDLFALPSKVLHNKERIRACDRHPGSNFLNIVATDYSLLLMDERYCKYPVLKWEHMMSTPPQYMSCVDGSPANQDDNFLYAAGQYPADVHAFRFSLRNGLPPISTSQAHRAAKFTDISKWPPFVDKCPNTALLHDRLDTSLAGISTLPWRQGHVIFQLDSHGEIFHQVFSADQSSTDMTFSAGLGSHDLQVLPVAAERAQAWINSWVEMMKQQLAPQIKSREVHASLLGLYYYRNPDKSCCICQPDLGFMPGEAESPSETAYCQTCMVLLKDGRNLLHSVQKDEVMACTSERQPQGLKEVNELPVETALSKLLMKQWHGDKDGQRIEDIFKDWDKEVLERRSAKKQQRKTETEDMSEGSVMKRILNIESGSSPARKQASSRAESWEPSTSSSVNESDELSNSAKKRQRSEKGHTSVKSRERDDESVSSSRKRLRMEHRKTAGSNQDVGSSIQVSMVNDSVESVVMGSVDSSVSDTFRFTGEEEPTAGLPGLASFLAQSRKQSASQPKKPSPRKSNKDSVFLSPKAVPKSKSKNSQASKSPGKSRHEDSKNRRNSAESSHSIKTVSEMSFNTGSEDLFNDSLQTVELASVDDNLSSVLSVANFNIISNSQMSNNVSRTLFASQNSGNKTLDRIVSSPKKGGVSTSPSKRTRRKPLAGF